MYIPRWLQFSNFEERATCEILASKPARQYNWQGLLRIVAQCAGSGLGAGSVRCRPYHCRKENQKYNREAKSPWQPDGPSEWPLGGSGLCSRGNWCGHSGSCPFGAGNHRKGVAAVIESNLTTNLMACKAVLLHMMGLRSGVIVNLTSKNAARRGRVGQAHLTPLLSRRWSG